MELRALAILFLLFVSSVPDRGHSAERIGTEIADAVEHKEFAKVRQLIDAKAAVNAKQNDGMTALHWAAFHNRESTVKHLLSAGAGVNQPNDYGVRPLTIACLNGSEPIISLLLEYGADPNSSRDGSESAVHTASRTGSVGAVTALIKAGAKPNPKDHRGQTALMWAAAEGNTEVVQLLLKHQVDPAETLPSGFNALTFAIRNGHIDTAKVLINAGMDVNQPMSTVAAKKNKPDSGMSPLMLAIENGHFELALMLLNEGANPNDDRTGFAPLHALSWVRKPEIGDNQRGNPPPQGSGNLTSLEFAKQLVSHGADVNLPKRSNGGSRLRISVKGATPFLCAASTADVAYMEVLIALGADPSATTAKRQNALMMAAGIDEGANADGPATADEHQAAVLYVLSLNANELNALDANNQSIMHAAAYKSLPKVIHLFDQRGADIDVWNQPNKQGRTPLAIARGFRPGNFKPDFATVRAIEQVMRKHKVTIPLPQQKNPAGWKAK